MSDLLEDSQIFGHPVVLGEIGLGSLANRGEVLRLLRYLPRAAQATHDEVMSYIDTHRLFGLGIGYVDAHLLASTALTGHASRWTRDKRLRAAASDLGSLSEHH